MKNIILKLTKISYLIYVVLILLYVLIIYLLDTWDYTYETKFIMLLTKYAQLIVYGDITLYNIFCDYALYLIVFNIVFNFFTRIAISKSGSKKLFIFLGIIKILTLSILSGLATIFYGFIVNKEPKKSKKQEAIKKQPVLTNSNYSSNNQGYNQNIAYNPNYKFKKLNDVIKEQSNSSNQTQNQEKILKINRNPYYEQDLEVVKKQTQNYDYNSKYNQRDNDKIQTSSRAKQTSRSYDHKVYRITIASIFQLLLCAIIEYFIIINPNMFSGSGATPMYFIFIVGVFIAGASCAFGYDNKRRCFKKSYKKINNGMHIEEVKNIMRLYPIVSKGYNKSNCYILEYKIQSFRQYEHIRLYFYDDNLFDHDISYRRIVTYHYQT